MTAISVFGLNVSGYGLFVAAGAAFALWMYWYYAKVKKLAQGTTALFGALGIPLALVCARLLFVFTDGSFRNIGSFGMFYDVTGGGFSMMGALAGLVLACCLAAKITKQKTGRLLDVLAASVFAFILFERFGEKYTTLGLSRPLQTDWLIHSFLSVQDTYDAYLRVYLLEAVAACVLYYAMFSVIKKEKRDGNTFLVWMLLFGATQTIMESLRYDQHMSFEFVGVQHIMAITVLCVAIIIFTSRAAKVKSKKLYWALAVVPPGVAAGLVLEFAIDRSSLSRFLEYGLYVVLMVLMAGTGFAMKKVSEQNG